MGPNIDVVDLISTLLDSEKYKEVLDALNEDKLAQNLRDNFGELLSVVIGKISDETLLLKPSLYGTCEQSLNILIEKSSPEEALLEFIEQIEIAKNDAQFSIILPPLLELLKKLSSKRGRSLEWCLNSITTYIENIPIPEYHLERKERILVDSDPNIRRVARVCSVLPSFYRHFISELSKEPNTMTKEILTAFLISLLGKPMIYIDLNPENNKDSENRACCENFLQDICSLERNVFKFLSVLETCHNESLKTNIKEGSDYERSPYEHREKINMTTLSGLFYIILSGHFEIPEHALPQIYSMEYILHTIMLCVIHLLNFAEYSPIAKALALFDTIMSRFPDNTSCDLLLSPVHFDVCKGLMNISVYSTYDTLRKKSYMLMGRHIEKFNYRGRCTLIKYIIETAPHTGLIGYAINIYKNSMHYSFQDNLDECFSGAQLTIMLKKFCSLPQGAETDLYQLGDQIVTTLNFLRFIVLRDTSNISGIHDNFKFIEDVYLNTLRLALNMSKAHYELKLKDIEEGKDGQDEPEISVSVGGSVMDQIPAEKKKEIINSALNLFHLMEALRSTRRIIGPINSVSVNNSPVIIRNYSQEPGKDGNLTLTSINSNTEHEEQQYEDNVKERILQNALEFVPKSGWSVESLTAGAKAAGYPSITHGLFPNGGGDLVHYFNVKCNEQLVAEMKSWPKEELKESKVPAKFIENAIATRLFMINSYKSTWAKAMAIQALPNNVPNCLATLLSLVDDICYHSGDRSVNFNWYVRRVGLAGIYKTTELFYLTDSSPDHINTRNFVASRIRDAELVQTALNLNPVSVAPQTLSAAFTTAKNILGINSLK